jgi:hypothetical protein
MVGVSCSSRHTTNIQIGLLFLIGLFSAITEACRCSDYSLENSYEDPSTQVMRVKVLGEITRSTKRFYVAEVRQKYNEGNNEKADLILIQSATHSCGAKLSEGKWLVSVAESTKGAGVYDLDACDFHKKWKNLSQQHLDYLKSGGVDEGGNLEPFNFMQCPETGECCNGLQSNCDLRPDEMMWAFVHNANHDDFLIPNNEAPLEQALEAGYRGLMLDVCLCQDETGNSVLQFCHSICGIGKRDSHEVFTNINTFLTNNPTEVVFINFEISSGNPTPQLIWDAVKTAGLDQKSFLYSDSFPSMRNLLEDGKQLILSKHNGYDCTDPNVEGCTSHIFEHFTQVIETNYDFEDVNAIEDITQSCPATRGFDGTKRFYSINNFVTSRFGPSKSAADIVNQKAFIEKRIADCESIMKKSANFVNVDFWQRGDLLRVTQEINISRGKSKRSIVNIIGSFFGHLFHH